MKKILFSICIAIMAVCLVSCSSNSPESVVEQYYNCLADENYEEAIELMHFKKEMTAEQKEQFVVLMKKAVAETKKENKKIKNFEVGAAELKPDGEKGKVNVNISYEDGSTKVQTADVIKVDGKWMIDMGNK